MDTFDSGCLPQLTRQFEIKAVPFSVTKCLGTLECCVNICSSARITEVVSGLRSDTAKRYQENKSQAVSF